MGPSRDPPASALLHVDSLDVHKLLDPVVGEFAAVSTFLDAAKGKPGVRLYEVVGTIPHDALLARVRSKVVDGCILSLVEMFLKQGVLEGMGQRP